MRRNVRRSTTTAAETPQAFGMYDVAYLAGGARRVTECAVIALAERGLLVIRATRMRAAGGELPEHPVERALLAACPRSRSTASVCAALRDSPEVEEIGSRLSDRRLVRGARGHLTRAGRQRLRAAEQSAHFPAYVFEGPAVLPAGAVRRGAMEVRLMPSGMGRALIRMGNALDHDFGSGHSDSGSGCGSSCGGGGGGGGGGD